MHLIFYKWYNWFMSTSMSRASAKNRLRLLRRWDNQCAVCGHQFTNLACVSIEHIAPRSLGGRRRGENQAPSHYRCNMIKGSRSLLWAFNEIERQRERRGDAFETWLNARVPGRRIPWYAFLPPFDAAWFV